MFNYEMKKNVLYSPRHEISNNEECATRKGSHQPAHTQPAHRTFACRLNILRLLRYCLVTDRTAFGVSKLKRRLYRLV